jgi:hypothetical protein
MVCQASELGLRTRQRRALARTEPSPKRLGLVVLRFQDRRQVQRARIERRRE